MEQSSSREHLLGERPQEPDIPTFFESRYTENFYPPEPAFKSIPASGNLPPSIVPAVENRPPSIVPARKPVQLLKSTHVSESKQGHQVTAEDMLTGGPRVRKRSLYDDLQSWKLEVLALIFSTIILVILVITLYIHHDKPLSSWPHSLSINSIISFETLLFKTSLVFAIGSTISQSQWIWFANARSLQDAVSYADARGPVGSLAWLIKDIFGKFKRPLTSLGAFLLIVVVLIDPFVQLLVQYENCPVDVKPATSSSSGGIASISRTSVFNPQMLNAGAKLVSPNSASQSPVLSGLFAQPPDVSFECSTGNCTFGSYSTVGWCSKCEDVSESLAFGHGPQLYGQTVTNPITYLPDGFSINGANSAGVYNYLTVQFNVSTSTMQVIQPWLNLTPDNDPIYTEYCTKASKATDWPCQGYGAASCTFSPCVQSYTATATSGKLTETLIDSVSFEPGDPKDITYAGPGEIQLASNTALVDTQCLTANEVKSLKVDGYTIDPQTRWLTFNMTSALASVTTNATYPKSAPYPQSMLANGCLYLISQDFRTGYPGFFLQSILNGTATGLNESGAPGGAFLGPQVIQNMLNFGNTSAEYIGTVMDNAAASLTNYMRENGVVGYSGDAQGSASHFETCGHIRWGWIALPIILDLLAMILLALSIWATWRRQAPIWKDSILAFVFHGPGNIMRNAQSASDSSDERSGGFDTIENMKARAKNITVKLDDSEPNEVRLELVDCPKSAPVSGTSPVYQAFARF